MLKVFKNYMPAKLSLWFLRFKGITRLPSLTVSASALAVSELEADDADDALEVSELAAALAEPPFCVAQPERLENDKTPVIASVKTKFLLFIFSFLLNKNNINRLNTVFLFAGRQLSLILTFYMRNCWPTGFWIHNRRRPPRFRNRL